MRFPMMSVYKLPIVIHALRLSECGRLDLSERVTLMPEDRRPNEAEFAADYHGLCCIADMRPFSLEKFTAMTDRVPTEVRALAAKAYESDPRDTATPAGYATLLVRLYRRELLNEASTKWLLDLMQQMHARDGRIRAGLPAGTPAALRRGTCLTAGVRAAHNDTGIITLPGGRGHLAIAVFLKGADGTEEARDAAIARVARAAYEWATSTGAPSHRQ